MPKNFDSGERVVELLRALIIVQLGLAGVGQAQIRKIVGGSMNDINAIVKLLRSGRRGQVKE
ncbi:MAG: hypothetical protein Q7S58_20395 [Candidatus Binatus sp.]|uniref:hypothetical protein n=1 Tax=Candidatus Binatus sp. TaxID=2811406 RepID=UPI00271571CD|nr:hypothetical protein [Candidatus Binatus sp.]MDO8434764.1 hypothetical protein [Candidatus Binatus sp.]